MEGEGKQRRNAKESIEEQNAEKENAVKQKDIDEDVQGKDK